MSSVAAPSGTWRLDPHHSTALFSVHYIAGRYRAGFTSFDAKLELDGAEPRLEGAVDVSSLTIGLDVFKQHMLGDEFFDAEQHPQLRFASTSFQRDGGRVTVEGELTMRGVTKPVTARGWIGEPIETLASGPSIGLQLEAAVNRSDWGFGWNPSLPGGAKALAETITLEIDLVFLADQ